MIKVLNSKTRQHLEEINIPYRTTTTLEIKKFLMKKNQLTQLKIECEALNTTVRKFHSKFSMLHKKGLPEIVSSNDQLVKLEDYYERLYTIAADNSKFAVIKRHITGKDFFEALSFDLTIKYEVGHLFITNPNFERYNEVDEIFRRTVNI